MPSNQFRRIQRLLDDGMKAPKPKSGYAYRVGSSTPRWSELSGFEKVIDVLQRPLYATASFADTVLKGGDPFGEAAKGFVGHRKTTFSDVLGTAGMSPGLARSALGFTADVVADPLNLLTIAPIAKAGKAVVKGVPVALSKTGVAARQAAHANKAAQVARLEGAASRLAKVAETTPSKAISTLLPSGVKGTITATDALRLRQSRLEGLVKKAGPEAHALYKAGMIDRPKALSAGFGEKAFQRALGAETRVGAKEGAEKLTSGLQGALPAVGRDKLVAPTALKLGPIPLIKGSTAKKIVAPIGKAYRAVEAMPKLGAPLRVASKAAAGVMGGIRHVFSTKTGLPEFDLGRGRAMDLGRLEASEAQKWWLGEVGTPLKAKYGATKESLKSANDEVIKVLEGVRDPNTGQKVIYRSQDPFINDLAGKVRQRYDEIFRREQEWLTLPPEYRVGYAAHIMKPEAQAAIIRLYRQNAGALTRPEFSAGLGSSLRRAGDETISEVSLDDLIGAGVLDPDKVEKELAREGIRLSSSDRLLFEADPVVAGLGRELSSIKAVNSAKFAEDILSTPTFVRAKGNVADPASLANLRKTVQDNPGHAIFVPSKAVIEHLRTPAQREAIRRGGEPDLVISLLKELLDPEAEQIARAGKAVEAYVIPREVAEHLSKAYKAQRDPESLKAFLRIYDPALSWWKAWATGVRPAFHIRNFASGVWQNMLAGVRNPSVYVKAAAIANSPGMRGKIRVGQYTGQQIHELGRRFGVVGTGWIASDAGEAAAKAIRPSKNPLATTGPVVRFGQSVGTRVEDTNRLALFIDAIEKGADPQSAALLTKKYHFDYSDMTNIERGLLKRGFPFYAYTRFNIPLVVETLIKDPGKVAILGKVRAEMEKRTEAMDQEYVADFVQESFGIPVRKNDRGEFEYWLAKGFIPTADLAKLDAEELLGMMSPFVKEPLEQWLNTDFFRLRPISRFPEEKVQFLGMAMHPRVAHFLRNIVILSWIDRDALSASSSPKKALQSNLAFRLYSQDPVSQMKRYVFAIRAEKGQLKVSANLARKNGQNSVAESLDERVKELQTREDLAEFRAKELDPQAFSRKKAAEPKQATPDFNTLRQRMKRETSIDAILKKQRRAQ